MKERIGQLDKRRANPVSNLGILFHNRGLYRHRYLRYPNAENASDSVISLTHAEREEGNQQY
jgi:hypothetical protein